MKKKVLNAPSLSHSTLNTRIGRALSDMLIISFKVHILTSYNSMGH